MINRIFIRIPIPALKATMEATPTTLLTLNGLYLTILIRWFMWNIYWLANINLLEHCNSHLICHLKGVLTQTKFNTFRCIFVNTLFYLFNCWVILRFKWVGVIVTHVEWLSWTFFRTNCLLLYTLVFYILQASIANIELLWFIFQCYFWWKFLFHIKLALLP